MASSVLILFNQNTTSSDVFAIQDALTPSQEIRVDYGQLGLLQPIVGSDIDETISLTLAYLNSTYNNTNLYTITADFLSDSITITANNGNSQFSLVENSTSGRVSITISNDVLPDPEFEISTVTIAQAATDQADNVSITVTTNQQATNITSPITQAVTTNPFTFETIRAGAIDITMNDANNSDTSSIFVPRLLVADYTVNVSLDPAGGSITVTNSYTRTPAFSLEYSLDNVTFFSSNAFSSLSVGSHTVYIRDNIGSSISIAFTIGTFTPDVDPRQDIVFVSNANSFRFKEDQDLTTNIRTVDNTLSFEENYPHVDTSYRQPWEKTDGIIPTQVRTSHETVTATLTDCDGNETALTVTKKTDNLGITDVRDGQVFSVSYLEQQYVGVRMSSGNLYDPTTLADTGDYNLGGELPFFVQVGDYINIQSQGWIEVINISRINNFQTAIVNLLASDFNVTIPTDGLLRRITSIYNLLPTEDYEFNVDLSSLEGFYQIKITTTDSEFTGKTLLSEYIDVQESQPCTHLVQWYNTVNNQINYSTGIRHKARFRYMFNVGWSPSQSPETFNSDTNTVLVRSIIRDFYTASLHALPTQMARKFILAAANDRFFIDSISYVAEAEAEALWIRNTNNYVITQQLTRADFVFDNIAADGDQTLGNVVPLAINADTSRLLLIS